MGSLREDLKIEYRKVRAEVRGGNEEEREETKEGDRRFEEIL